MNFRQFVKKNEGRVVKLRPIPLRRLPSGGVRPRDDGWRVEVDRYRQPPVVELRNTATDNVVQFTADMGREYVEPDTLILMDQLIIEGRKGYRVRRERVVPGMAPWIGRRASSAPQTPSRPSPWLWFAAGIAFGVALKRR